MPRAKLILQNQFPYHVTARSVNQSHFELPLDLVWRIMSNQLFFLHHAFGVRIHSFVLMSNHFHMIISTPQSNLSSCMEWFMRETSREMNRLSHRINQSYGTRYFKSIISTQHYFLHAYKYVYFNPVAAKIVSCVEDYSYSTLRVKLGLQHSIIPLIEDYELFTSPEETLVWLNTHPQKENWECVTAGLKRSKFKIKKDGRKMHHLENQKL